MFVVHGTALAGLAACGASRPSAQTVATTTPKEPEHGDDNLSPTEDLMREHGLLERALGIYTESARRLRDGERDNIREQIRTVANVARDFVEAYHERLEEQHVFPVVARRADELGSLVATLADQHAAGRQVTTRILHLVETSLRDDGAREELAGLLDGYGTMMRPHIAREDTVIFPALRAILDRSQIDALAATFEAEEHRHFGDNGFESQVALVASVESVLGLADLRIFDATPGSPWTASRLGEGESPRPPRP